MILGDDIKDEIWKMKRSQTQEGTTSGAVSSNVLRQEPIWPLPKSLWLEYNE